MNGIKAFPSIWATSKAQIMTDSNILCNRENRIKVLLVYITQTFC